MASHRIADSARVRLVIDGLEICTTAKEVRRGAISTCIYRLMTDFEKARDDAKAQGKPPCIGYSSTYDDANGKSRNLQIDLVCGK
jgi:hypothetical protein